MIEQAELLEHDTEAPAQSGQLGALQNRQVAPEQGDQTARWAFRHENKLEKGAFAGAGWPGQEGEGPRIQRKTHIAQNLRPGTVAHTDIFEANHAPLKTCTSRRPATNRLGCNITTARPSRHARTPVGCFLHQEMM